MDCEIPGDLKPYIVYTEGSAIRMVEIDKEQLQLADGRRGIKANNGVLLIGPGSKEYEIVASPDNQTSGVKPATTDVKSYGWQNQLEPVIERKNYAAGEYLVLKGNQFHSIRSNASKVKACKAVLKK